MSTETELPQIFGRYVLTTLLAEGGMAEVYLASVRVAEGLTKRVVIKKIRKEFADQSEFTRMFVDEAKIALGLNHGNIVQVFDFGQVRGTFYLAMELVEGVDLMRLFNLVRERGDRFPVVIAAYLAHQIAAGLAYAHRKRDDFGNLIGIVHRDVSPHNVMVSYEGHVKILDFGIARTRTHALGAIDEPGATIETIKGKVAYMSPEQAAGRPLDARSDLYSLGVVMHELLSGELLFRRKDRMEALQLVRNQPIPSLREVAPDIPQALVRIVDRALDRDPEGRYESARSLQADLALFLHGSDPVVDDEAVSAFVSRYHSPTPGRPAEPPPWEQQATRELGDTDGSGVAVSPVRESQRVVVVHVALEPRRLLPSDPVPEPGPFLTLATDIAFKRDAHPIRVDAEGVVLAFGAVMSSSDDVERAIRVALALREEVVETAPGVAVGVVVAGTYAIVHRGEAGPLEVELPRRVSSRIERVARRSMEGPILVSSDLVERVARLWRFGSTTFVEQRSSATTTGSPIEPELDQAVPLLGPVTAGEQRAEQLTGARRPLYGRELELKSLRDALSEAIRTRQTRAVMVLGAPGLGKRSLVERFMSGLPRTACWVLRTTGSWQRRHVPLGVFLDLLSRFLHLAPGSDRDEVERRLQAFDVQDAPRLAEALAAALGLPGVASEGLDPLERRDRLWLLLRRFVRTLAQRRPVVLLVENLHFLDEQSQQLLRQWGETSHTLPLLVVVTARAGARAEQLRALANLAVIELRELDAQSSRELIVQRFEDPAEAGQLADAIVARTGGNPLFIEETLAALMHQGVVGWNAQGRFMVVRTPSARIDVPPSVEAALLQRIEGLPPTEHEVLLAASVLGRVFRSHEVDALLERACSRSLENLVQADLLERDASPSQSGDLRFATVSLHEVCRAAIGPLPAAELNARAAELKRRRPDYSPGRDDGPIADHLSVAGRATEAIDFALRAAHDANEVAGNVEAYYYLSLALKGMDERDERRFDALLQREAVLRAWGRRRAQSADIRQLIQTAERARDDRMEVTASLRLLRFYLEVGRSQAAERLLPRVIARTHSLADPRGFLPVLGELESDLRLSQGRLEDAERVATEALARCQDDPLGIRQRCRLCQAVGHAQLGTGKYDTARQSFEEALALARRLGDRRLEAGALNALGEVSGRTTHYQQAVDYFRSAINIDRDLGDRFATGIKLGNLGTAYAAIGVYRRAERYLRKALELHAASGHEAHINDVIVHLGEVVAHLGDLEGARELLGQAERVAARRNDLRLRLRARVRLARALVNLGQTETELREAESIAHEVLEHAGGGHRTAKLRALQVLTRLAERAGDPARALAFARSGLDLYRAGAAPRDGVVTVHQLGRLMIQSGDGRGGRTFLEEAAATVRARLDQLRDDDLRTAYLEQPVVAAILRDGEEALAADG